MYAGVGPAYDNLKQLVRSSRDPSFLAGVIIQFVATNEDDEDMVDEHAMLETLVSDSAIPQSEKLAVKGAITSRLASNDQSKASYAAPPQGGQHGPAGISDPFAAMRSGYGSAQGRGGSDPFGGGLGGGSARGGGGGAFGRGGGGHGGSGVGAGGWGSAPAGGPKDAAKTSTQAYDKDLSPIERAKKQGWYQEALEQAAMSSDAATKAAANTKLKKLQKEEEEWKLNVSKTKAVRAPVPKVYTFNVRVVLVPMNGLDVDGDELAFTHTDGFEERVNVSMLGEETFEVHVIQKVLEKANEVATRRGALSVDVRNIVIKGEGKRGGWTDVWASSRSYKETTVGRAQLEDTTQRDLYIVPLDAEQPAVAYLEKTFYKGAPPSRANSGRVSSSAAPKETASTAAGNAAAGADGNGGGARLRKPTKQNHYVRRLPRPAQAGARGLRYLLARQRVALGL